MCKTKDCNKSIRAKNLCQYHYYRSMRHRYANDGSQDIVTDNPHPKTLEAKKEFNEGLWQFIKKELNINA